MIYYPSVRKYRDIVQLVERWSPKPNVEGSSPSAPVDKSVRELVNTRVLAFFLFYRKLFPVMRKFCRQDKLHKRKQELRLPVFFWNVTVLA